VLDSCSSTAFVGSDCIDGPGLNDSVGDCGSRYSENWVGLDGWIAIIGGRRFLRCFSNPKMYRNLRTLRNYCCGLSFVSKWSTSFAL